MEHGKSTDPRTIFIRGISFSVDDAQLTEHFSSIGPVRHAFLVKTKDGQKHKGYGFVHYALEDDAERAIEELHGTELAGRKMQVESAVKRAPLEQRKPKRKTTPGEEDATGEENATGEDLERETKDGKNKPTEKALRGKTSQKVTQQDEHRGQLDSQGRQDKKKGSEKHVLLRTVALGGLSSAEIDAAVAFCKSLGQIESIETSTPQAIIRQYKLSQDGCTGEVLLLKYPSIKDAMDAVSALHGKHLPKELEGLRKRGRKNVASGHNSLLWARQVSGEGLHMKKWRLIVRNLPFTAAESDVRKAFASAGFVWEVSVPVKADGRPRGFAFVGFTCKSHAEKGIKSVNGTKIAGRVVAVDWAVAKSDYEQGGDEEKDGGMLGSGDAKEKKKHGSNEDTSIEDGDAEEEKEEERQQQKPKKILGQENDDNDHHITDMDIEKERGMFHSIIDDILGEENQVIGLEDGGNEEEGIEEEEEEEDDDDEHDDDEHDVVAHIKRRAEQISQKLDPRNRQQQQQSGVTDATVFVRGLALDTSKEQLFDAMRTFGPIRSCRLVMNKETGKPKGTAFVDFKYPDSAKAASSAAEKARHKEGVGVVVAGKRVEVDVALGGDAARQLAKDKAMAGDEGKDKRNLYLAKEGLIMEGGPAWEDLSSSDRAKRKRAQEDSKLKLKSPNFCISKTRLNVRNVPRAWDEKKLKALFTAAVKERAVKANPKIIQVKILKEDDTKGANVAGRSKGIAFVEFSEHEHALCALRQLNNNPETWSKDHRPIIEFAIDNVKALKVREKKLVMSKNASNGGVEGDLKLEGKISDENKKRRKKEKKNKAEGDGEEAGEQEGHGEEDPKSKRKLRQERRMMLKKLQRQQQGKQKDDDDNVGEKSKSKRRREQRKRKKDDSDAAVPVVKKKKDVGGEELGARKRKMREEAMLDALASAGVDEGRRVAAQKKVVSGKVVEKKQEGKRWFD